MWKCLVFAPRDPGREEVVLCSLGRLDFNSFESFFDCESQFFHTLGNSGKISVADLLHHCSPKGIS